MADTQINLIQKNAGGLGQLASLETVLRKASIWYVAALCVAGLVLGSIFLFVQTRKSQLDQKNVTVVRDINAQSAKEGILVSLKQRTVTAGKALDAAKPWGKLFEKLTGLADQSVFTQVSVDENGKVTTSFDLDSVDDAVSLVSNTLTMTSNREIRLPQMLSFALRDDGRVQMVLSFVPVF